MELEQERKRNGQVLFRQEVKEDFRLDLGYSLEFGSLGANRGLEGV